MSGRKPGRRTKSFEGVKTSKVLKGAKCLIHPDFGGRDPIETMQAKAAARGIDLGPRTAAFALEIIKEQCACIRSEVFPLIDEVVERLEATPPITERSE